MIRMTARLWVLSLVFVALIGAGCTAVGLPLPEQNAPADAAETAEETAGMEESEGMEMEEMDMGGSMPADALEPRETENGLFRITATSQMDPVTINEIHSWVLHVERPDGTPVENATITVDGGMPAHNHGFPTAPEVTEYLGEGDYLLEGVRFNMGGEWVMDVTVEADGESDTAQFVFTLQ